MKYNESLYICPLCRAPMKKEGKSFFCTGERRHCYDISKSGYVNLLPPGKASNAKTGDDRGMLASRRRFLETGSYDAISDTVARCILSGLGNADAVIFADAGCGEGYHTLNIAKKLREKCKNVVGIGLDASKHGAEAAAKRARALGETGVSFAAANIFDMPLADGCCDAVVSMFAPVADRECARVLRADGVLIVCSSGSRHLWELRQIIYGDPIVSPPLCRVPDGFESVGHTSLCYSFTLEEPELITALFEMTPFYYRCPAEGRERLMKTDLLKVRAEVEYNIYKKVK